MQLIPTLQVATCEIHGIGSEEGSLWLTRRTSKRAGGSGGGGGANAGSRGAAAPVEVGAIAAVVDAAMGEAAASTIAALAAEIIDDDCGRSLATLEAFLARFRRAAANEEEDLSWQVMVGEGGVEAAGEGRLIDDKGEEARDVTLLVFAMLATPTAAAAAAPTGIPVKHSEK